MAFMACCRDVAEVFKLDLHEMWHSNTTGLDLDIFAARLFGWPAGQPKELILLKLNATYGRAGVDLFKRLLPMTYKQSRTKSRTISTNNITEDVEDDE